MSYDATLAFPASVPTNGTPNSYLVTWLYGAAGGPPVAQTPISIPQSAAQDLTGYTSDFGSAFPSITLAPGDTLGATVVAVDATNAALNSPPVVAPTVTIPAAPVPLLPPASAAITITQS
jgi:hypothetical protein